MTMTFRFLLFALQTIIRVKIIKGKNPGLKAWVLAIKLSKLLSSLSCPPALKREKIEIKFITSRPDCIGVMKIDGDIAMKKDTR